MTIRQIGRRTMSLLLALVLVFSLSSAALAANSQTPSNYGWEFAVDDSGKLYDSYSDAWNAARKGTTITLLRDWTITDHLYLGKNEVANINMNGHFIHSIHNGPKDGEAIYLDTGASLTLRGCNKDRETLSMYFTYDSFVDYETIEKTKEATTSIPVGGIIMGNGSSNGSGGVQMDTGSTLTLDHVAIAGNAAYSGDDSVGGGIMMDGDNCKVYMYGSTVEGNYSSLGSGWLDGGGGGVYIDGDDCTLSMSQGSRICDNYTPGVGGGIYVNGDDAVIVLSGGSTIANNSAGDYGGGIYVDEARCTIRSSDQTGTITANTAIEFDGGGVYVDGKDCTLRDITITDNFVSANRMGGGVFVDSEYDIRLSGKVVIKNNYRQNNNDSANKNNPDDLFLEDGSFTRAYIITNPGAGSEIGIRTDLAAENGNKRKIGEDAGFTENYFFSDLKNFYLNADASENELNLKCNSGSSYPVYVNGSLQGYYNDTAILTIDGTSRDSSKVFQKWVDDTTTITGTGASVTYLDDITSAVATIGATPIHRRALAYTAVYATKITYVALEVAAPEAGQPLPATGTLKYFTGAGHDGDPDKTIGVPITWLKLDGSTQAVTGNAEYGTVYRATVEITEDLQQGVIFSDDIEGKVTYTGITDTGSSVKENTTEPEYENNEYIYTDVNGTLRKLYVYGKDVVTGFAKVEAIEAPAEVTITKGSTVEQLRAALPSSIILTTNEKQVAATLTYSQQALAALDLTQVTGEQPLTVHTYTYWANLDFSGLQDTLTAPFTYVDSHQVDIAITVHVVEKEVLSAPAASPESGKTYYAASDGVETDNDTGAISLNVTLENTDKNAGTITYKQINSKPSGSSAVSDVTYNADTGITLTAEKGEIITYVVSATAIGDGNRYTDSNPATYTYVLDNRYTVTVKKVCKVGNQEYELGTYTARYGLDAKDITIPAPKTSGYTFIGWGEAKGIEVSDETAEKITGVAVRSDITLTAYYAPIVTINALDISLSAPNPGAGLAANLTGVSAEVSAKNSEGETVRYTLDMTEYVTGDIEWYTGSTRVTGKTAKYSTAYTAKIKLPKDSTLSFRSIGSIVVNGGAATGAIEAENGTDYYLVVTFPATGAGSTVVPKPSESDKSPIVDVTKDDRVYDDVKKDDWFYDDVVYVREKGLMQGTGSDHFSPYLSTTRGMVVTILYRLEGEPAVAEGTPFSDVAAGSYYENAVTWAVENKIVNGYGNGKFGPDDCITREQLAAILYRYAQSEGRDVSVGGGTNLLRYDDALSISKYAVSAMKWAVGSGLIQGSDNKLSPAATATRSQLAAILHRYCG